MVQVEVAPAPEGRARGLELQHWLYSPANGVAFTFACWPMPNPASLGLPNPTSYTDGGDGTVRDNVTGLLWQKAIDATTQKLTRDAAKSYCAALQLAGHTWRLPTRIELLSIVDFTRVGAWAINYLDSIREGVRDAEGCAAP